MPSMAAKMRRRSRRLRMSSTNPASMSTTRDTSCRRICASMPTLMPFDGVPEVTSSYGEALLHCAVFRTFWRRFNLSSWTIGRGRYRYPPTTSPLLSVFNFAFSSSRKRCHVFHETINIFLIPTSSCDCLSRQLTYCDLCRGRLIALSRTCGSLD